MITRCEYLCLLIFLFNRYECIVSCKTGRPSCGNHRQLNRHMSSLSIDFHKPHVEPFWEVLHNNHSSKIAWRLPANKGECDPTSCAWTSYNPSVHCHFCDQDPAHVIFLREDAGNIPKVHCGTSKRSRGSKVRRKLPLRVGIPLICAHWDGE